MSSLPLPLEDQCVLRALGITDFQTKPIHCNFYCVNTPWFEPPVHPLIEACVVVSAELIRNEPDDFPNLHIWVDEISVPSARDVKELFKKENAKLSIQGLDWSVLLDRAVLPFIKRSTLTEDAQFFKDWAFDNLVENSGIGYNRPQTMPRLMRLMGSPKVPIALEKLSTIDVNLGDTAMQEGHMLLMRYLSSHTHQGHGLSSLDEVTSGVQLAQQNLIWLQKRMQHKKTKRLRGIESAETQPLTIKDELAREWPEDDENVVDNNRPPKLPLCIAHVDVFRFSDYVAPLASKL